MTFARDHRLIVTLALALALAAPAHAQPPPGRPAAPAPTADPPPPSPTIQPAQASQPITFRDAIRRAIAHNPDRLTALAEIDRVRGLLAQATSALLPQVHLQGMYTRIEGDRFVGMNRSDAANSVAARLTVDTPIVDLRAIAERKRARDTVDVTAADADAVKRAVAIATARAYFAALSSGQLLLSAIRARDTARAHVEYSRARRVANVGTELDLSRDESELATTEAQVASATIARLRAEEALGVIIGADQPLAPSDDPDLGEPRAGDGITARADVSAARERTAAAVWSRDHDWTDWTPSLHLNGDGFLDAPQIDPIPRLGYQLVLTLDMPLYDGGFRHGAHAQHLALEAEAHINEANIDRQASSDVRIARAAVADARAARDAAKLAADKAAHTLDLATIGYKAGTATGLEVVDAQRVALDAATQAVIAADDFRQAELDLLAATGAFPGRDRS
ncbi:MAG TPA: TolC family protein [Kofleriaceae bacterium]|nr:TolC family protein [Kofleriaceae bacterium]